MRPTPRIVQLGGPVWQWDADRSVGVKGADAVHFAYPGDDEALVVIVGDDGTAEIPNQLLTRSGTIRCWTYDAESERTTGELLIPVAERAKPSDYVYTPTEVETVASVKRWVEERIAEIEVSGGMEIGHGLKMEDGKVCVDCADAVEVDNTLPVTSAAVYTEVGNIEALLATV